MLVNLTLEIKGFYEDYISMLHAFFDLLTFNDRAKMKLAILAFLYCGEFVKNSIACVDRVLCLIYAKVHKCS